jgi:hypothetical protein
MEFLIAFLVKHSTDWNAQIGFKWIQKILAFLLVSITLVGIANSSIKGEISQIASEGGKVALEQLERFKIAIGLQESGSNYSAVNPDSKALGKYQVMPENVSEWSKEALGYEITPEQFLASPELQDKIVNFRLKKSLDDNAHLDEETQTRKAAGEWYGGYWGKDNFDNPNPQYYNGNLYPSVGEYTSKVYSKYKDIK